MKILCVICQDLLSEDIIFTRCGHVFHHHCLLQWLERSKTCPQCRDVTTENRIYKAHFTFSNTETVADNTDNLSLQTMVDNLKFQILLVEKSVQHYTSKNAVLEKQNAGLRREVRKVESEINQKNSAIYALKEQIKYLKDMHKTLSTGTLQDVQEMVGKTTDRDTLVNCISIMKETILKKTRRIESLQDQLTLQHNSLVKERSKSLEFKDRLAFSESENLSLQYRINILEKPLKITSDQDYITKPRSRRNFNKNSLINVQTVDIFTQQLNTKQETADQNGPSSPEAEGEIITDASQENSMHNSTFDDCPTVTKKARLCLRSGNSSDKTDLTTSDIKNTAGISSQSKQKSVKTKGLSQRYHP